MPPKHGGYRRYEKTKRQTFMKMYDRTCERVYFYAYEHVKNRRDADVIFRDAFVYMYEHIGSLRKSASLDAWQKQCAEKSFRALIRTGMLKLVADDHPEEATSLTLDEQKKEDLWNNINKMAEIDPWRLVPEPGRSSLFSVLADQTVSDMRYMSAVDYVKIVAIVGAVIAVLYVGATFIVKYIAERQGISVEPVTEVFLDERCYDGFEQWDGAEVDREEIDRLIKEAESTAEPDPEDKSGKFTPQAHVYRSAGDPILTGDLDIDAQLQQLVSELITPQMNDYEAIAAIYDYVGRSMTFDLTIRPVEKPVPENEFNTLQKMIPLIRQYFEYKAGDSAHYSAVVAGLAGAAGYRCVIIKGKFIFNRGNEFEHACEHYWNKIYMNGIVCYLDLEADANADGTQVRKYYFLAAPGTPRWQIFRRDHDPAEA